MNRSKSREIKLEGTKENPSTRLCEEEEQETVLREGSGKQKRKWKN